jgi:hypothetical protein
LTSLFFSLLSLVLFSWWVDKYYSFEGSGQTLRQQLLLALLWL